jgi:hypothetical protein
MDTDLAVEASRIGGLRICSVQRWTTGACAG